MFEHLTQQLKLRRMLLNLIEDDTYNTLMRYSQASQYNIGYASDVFEKESQPIYYINPSEIEIELAIIKYVKI